MNNNPILLLKKYIRSSGCDPDGRGIYSIEGLLAVCRSIREDKQLSDKGISLLVNLANDVFSTSYHIESSEEYHQKLMEKNRISR